MIKSLFAQVIERLSPGESVSAEDREAGLRLATAVLMIEVARADHVFDESEFDKVLQLVQAHFGLSAGDSADLVVDASARAEDLVDIHQFTKLLHDCLTEDEKAQIVSLLWQIAYADGELDKYEDSLVLKISDLLYVSRGRVMRLKNDVGKAVT